jgi:cytochrome bd ubiquinol oxidase subunit II
MGTIWFCFVAVMLVAYVVLDGFDIGAGILHFLLGRSNEDREVILRTIGPVWDGNEVWLLAAGGTLYFAFPLLYASAFSGFYLPLTIVLWLLVFRGLGIELRSHLHLRVWRGFFDGAFAFASAVLAIFFGAALANVIRGVPIGANGYFFAPLWTDWKPGPEPGILDWYTVIGGVLALIALAEHGALYIAYKTTGALHDRAHLFGKRVWLAVLLLTIVSLVATMVVRPSTLINYQRFPVAYLIPVGVIASLVAIPWYSRRERDLHAFLASCAYLALMLGGAAFALYPSLLPSTLTPENDITIANALSGPHTLAVGVVWWTFGMVLATAYFVFVYRMFHGKIEPGHSVH